MPPKSTSGNKPAVVFVETPATTERKRARSGTIHENAPAATFKRAKTDAEETVEPVALAADEDDEDEDAEGSDEDFEDIDEALPPVVKDRLRYIERNVRDLTSTFLRDIVRDLIHYMGPRSGGNAMVGQCIVNHCRNQALRGITNLKNEKRSVQSARRQCYGSCGDDEEEEEDYIIPDEVDKRLIRCMTMLVQLPEEHLETVIGFLPKYKPNALAAEEQGLTVCDMIVDHLDMLAEEDKADIIAEERFIENLHTKHC
ncbi:hypothetical protein C8J56DRAFT_1170581 [Mycena floridula]|nr:hypothetical protein C8J56DRAFT_1170581 [Mycena floridula]